MDEMKLRAWDDVAERMSYGKAEQFDDMLGFRFDHFETEKPVYMRWTGLVDKNGKEIYEGDILERISHLTGEKVWYKIEWDADNGRFMSIGIRGTIQELVSSAVERGCYVCGNIYA